MEEGEKIDEPSFWGTHPTSWNFFMWTTRTSGKVANRVCLNGERRQKVESVR